MDKFKFDRITVEKKVTEQVESIRVAQNLRNFDEVYDHVINHWFLYDAHWLRIVCNMKEEGRLK